MNLDKETKTTKQIIDMGTIAMIFVTYSVPVIIRIIIEMLALDISFSDSNMYIWLFNIFRGTYTSLGIWHPFYLRPMIPFLVACLPFSVQQNFLILNLCIFGVLNVFLWKLLFIYYSERVSFLCVLFHNVSFPVVVYCFTILVDLYAYTIIIIGIYYLIQGKSEITMILGVIGLFVKESVLLLLLILIALNIHRNINIVTVSGYLSLYVYSFQFGHYTGIYTNFTMYQTLSLIISFTPLLFIFLYWFIKFNKRPLPPIFVFYGFFSLLYFISSFILAYVTGRFLIYSLLFFTFLLGDILKG